MQKNCRKDFCHEYYECICDDADHVLRISYFLDAEDKIEYDELYAELRFIRAGFLGRIWRGLKYIFNFNTEPGWVTWVIDMEGAKEFRILLDRFIERKKIGKC